MLRVNGERMQVVARLGDASRSLTSAALVAAERTDAMIAHHQNGVRPRTSSPSPTTNERQHPRDPSHTVKMLIPKADRKLIHELVLLCTGHSCGAIEKWTFAEISNLELELHLTPLSSH